MKLFSFLLFISLIAFIFSSDCKPSNSFFIYFVSQCSGKSKVYSENECCRISYYDYDGDLYYTCYEMSAKEITHFDSYKSRIKSVINSNLWTHTAWTIYGYECSANYLSISIFALLLTLF